MNVVEGASKLESPSDALEVYGFADREALIVDMVIDAVVSRDASIVRTDESSNVNVR